MNALLTDTERSHLRRALRLAEGGRGRVSPNPMVGAVIARDGEVIGEGYHAGLGDLHAEAAALEDCRAAGREAVGATMYVTLEPCDHHGRQPPCSEAILAAGIERVVIASEDPSERAAGAGPATLRERGVEVEFADGEEALAARLLNQPFRKYARTAQPLVILKLAISLDGQTVVGAADSPWISSEPSRALVGRWRGELDAVAVGIGTVLADDPLLSSRDPDAARQPRRIVFDSRARLPLDSQLLATSECSQVLVISSAAAPQGRLEALREAGAEVILADQISSALAELGRRQITSVLLEGGARLAAAFTAAGEIDEARTFVAAILLGGAGRLEALDRAEDTLISARFREW